MRPALLALLFAVACSSSTAAAVAPTISPSRSGTGPPTSSPSTSPSQGDLPLSTVAFSCQLPVIRETIGSDSTSYQGGFITFPAATFTPDPAGLINSNQQTLALTTSAGPALSGVPQAGQPFYDAAANRWVPAGAGQTSPDGASYAYGISDAAGSTIHVVSVASATERTFKITVPSPATQPEIQVKDFDGRSAYYVLQPPDGYPRGTWRLDTSTGQMFPMAQLDNVLAVRAGSAWIGYLDPHDSTTQWPRSILNPFDSIVQVNLASGARTTWVYRPGQEVFLLAVDASGRPLVEASLGPDFTKGEVRRIEVPVSGSESNGQLVYNGSLYLGSPEPDGDRIWFGNDRGVYLYTSAAGLREVFSFTRTKGESLIPAGFCR